MNIQSLYGHNHSAVMWTLHATDLKEPCGEEAGKKKHFRVPRISTISSHLYCILFSIRLLIPMNKMSRLILEDIINWYFKVESTIQESKCKAIWDYYDLILWQSFWIDMHTKPSTSRIIKKSKFQYSIEIDCVIGLPILTPLMELLRFHCCPSVKHCLFSETRDNYRH